MSIFILTASCKSDSGNGHKNVSEDTGTGQLPKTTTAVPVKKLEEALQFKHQQQFKKALTKFHNILTTHPRNFTALWNTSYLYADLGYYFENPLKKRRYYDSAFYFAMRAYDIKPKNAEANFVMAMAHGRLAQISPLNQKIAHSKEVKNYVDRALAADPSHDKAHFLLGFWNYRISTLKKHEKLYARTIIGKAIDEADLEKAIKEFRNAIYHKPGEGIYHLYLGKSLIEKGKSGPAREAIKKALELEKKGKTAPVYHEEAQALLKKLNQKHPNNNHYSTQE